MFSENESGLKRGKSSQKTNTKSLASISIVELRPFVREVWNPEYTRIPRKETHENTSDISGENRFSEEQPAPHVYKSQVTQLWKQKNDSVFGIADAPSSVSINEDVQDLRENTLLSACQRPSFNGKIKKEKRVKPVFVKPVVFSHLCVHSPSAFCPTVLSREITTVNKISQQSDHDNNNFIGSESYLRKKIKSAEDIPLQFPRKKNEVRKYWTNIAENRAILRNGKRPLKDLQWFENGLKQSNNSSRSKSKEFSHWRNTGGFNDFIDLPKMKSGLQSEKQMNMLRSSMTHLNNSFETDESETDSQEFANNASEYRPNTTHVPGVIIQLIDNSNKLLENFRMKGSLRRAIVCRMYSTGQNFTNLIDQSIPTVGESNIQEGFRANCVSIPPTTTNCFKNTKYTNNVLYEDKELISKKHWNSPKHPKNHSATEFCSKYTSKRCETVS